MDMLGNVISIHALREEGDLCVGKSGEEAGKISIHALREEGDLCVGKSGEEAGKISIHALREEGDATGAYCRAKADDFYPRPPRGGRPPKNRFG